jgi:CheY-like chemotaxis protein
LGIEKAARHVLLVGDNEAFRATLRHLLTRRDHAVRVEEAADGEEALRPEGTERAMPLRGRA